jgi:hypothetical protein
MARVHLFELEDQTWCPQPIRETTTDFLAGLYHLLKIYEPAYEKIAEVLTKTNENAIVDCCTGSAGPIKQLREHLDKVGKESVTITLTDKYPNLNLFKQYEAMYPNKIKGYAESVDASHFPTSLKGMRTFFSSFHHFPPQLALKILQDAVNNGAPIGIFESTQRSPIDFIRTLFSPLFMLFVVPFAKRLTWRKFLLTYVLPITPFTNMWDYFVSNLRTYSPSELENLVKQLNAPGYEWEIGKLWSKKARCQVPYLIGYKRV